MSLPIKQLKLPLIEQSHSKPSNSSTKRSQFSHNSSINNSTDEANRKWKNLKNHSNFHQQHQKLSKKLQRDKSNPDQTDSIKNQHKYQNKNQLISNNLKQQLKTTPNHREDQQDSDFQEKIKENKLILKKHKLKKELQMRAKSISKHMDKENLEMTTSKQLDKLPEIRSKKVIDGNVRPQKKKLISFLANTDSREWVGTIMKGPSNQSQNTSMPGVINANRSRSLPKQSLKLLKSKLNTSAVNEQVKNSNDVGINKGDVFENIHLFLKSLEAEGFQKEKVLKQEVITRKMEKFKGRLSRIQPNSQFLKSLNSNASKINISSNLNSNQSFPSLSKCSNGREQVLPYLTSTQWRNVCLLPRSSQVHSSFDEQVDRINQFETKSNKSLEELLNNRKFIIDLLLIRKLKNKQKQKDKQRQKQKQKDKQRDNYKQGQKQKQKQKQRQRQKILRVR